MHGWPGVVVAGTPRLQNGGVHKPVLLDIFQIELSDCEFSIPRHGVVRSRSKLA